jgi:predicted membrane protein
MGKKWKYTAAAAVIFSAALIIAPWILPICGKAMQLANGGTAPMRCYFAYQAELPVSAAALITAVILFFVRGIEGRRLGGIFLALLGAIAVLIVQPLIIGVCTGHMASCHATRVWTVSVGSLLVLTGAVLAFIAPSSGRAEGPPQLEEGEE